ncbi:MAG: hypothetical protein H0T48_12540 [Gemmatimonadaceae bacterium]|nr:hypothetical protein [Gemmatimonadaceae bacterium]
MLSRAFLRLATVSVLVFATAGCGGGASDTTTTPSPTSPAPTALQGVWVTTLRGTGERVTLTLGATGYQINRGTNQANGAIGVSGDQINFSNSTACDGTGAYKWGITGTSLLFTAIAADACPGRSEVLAGYTYVKN